MTKPDLEWQKREISTLITEISDCEKRLSNRGLDIRDPDEWMQLRDIIARIERKLAAKAPV